MWFSVEGLRRRDELRYAGDAHDSILGHMVANFAAAQDAPGLVHLYTTPSAEVVDVNHPAHPFFTERYEMLRERMTGALRQLQAEGAMSPVVRVDAIARLLIAAMDGLQVQWLVDPHAVDMAGDFGYLWDLIRTATTPRGDSSTDPVA